jgi:hypothetical protein
VDLAETRVEGRRAETATFHDELHRREKLIRGVLKKLRGERPVVGVGVPP